MAVNNIVKRLQNIMRQDAGISGDAQRIEQMTWLFFLKVYDAQEELWEVEDDRHYQSIIPEPLRWRNWAVDNHDGKCLTGDDLLVFVNNQLFPTLKELKLTPDSPKTYWILKEVFTDLNQYMKNGTLLRQVVNVVDEIDFSDAEDRHTFGDIYEGILKDLQSAGHAGEFYTPRALTDFIVGRLDPRLGEKMADFTSGTGGFLTSTLNYLEKQKTTPKDETLWQQSVLGQEWKPLPYLLSVTNLMVHNVDEPNIIHCDSLGVPVSSFKEKDKVDVVAMNPPYGGSTEASVSKNFPSDMRSSETADLFMVLIMRRLKANGRAGVILPDGFLFGVDGAKLAIKTALLKEFNLHTIIRLPGSIFSPYTSIATNILFFNNEKADGAPEGYHTKETWFYRLDMPEGYKHFSKTKPMRVEHCQPIVEWWTDRKEIISRDEDGNVTDEKSRCFKVEELVAKSCNFDQCKFPKDEEEILPPAELLADYYKKRAALDHEIDRTLAEIERILGLNGSQASCLQNHYGSQASCLQNHLDSQVSSLQKSKTPTDQ
jgi:type I restriction enzyme M protein